MYPVQRIVVNCTFSLEWLRTLGKLSFTAALIISVSSGKAFFSLWSTRRGVSVKPSQFYCCTIHSRQNLISLGGYRVRGAYTGESFWSSYLPICVLFCQQETCAWAFFVQVYIEEYETAMGFGGGFFCLFVFFQFYQQSGWKVQFLREWLGFVLRALLTSKISCTWSVMCFCWNCVLMTVAGQMHQTHLYCMEPDVYQLLLCPFTSSVSCLIAY